MKYSLRSLMIVAVLMPPAIAFLYWIAALPLTVASGSLVLLAFWIAGAMVIVFRPDWLVPAYDDTWTFPWGEYDLFRRCLYNADGKMRRFVPAALLIWLMVWTLFVAILIQVFL